MVAAFWSGIRSGPEHRQGVIDGTMSVRVIKGYVLNSESSLHNWLQRGVTGARHVIAGKYGYYRLYEQGLYNPIV